MNNSQVHPVFQPVLESMFHSTAAIVHKHNKKEEIKAKILALPNELDKVPLMGVKIGLQNGYDFGEIIDMILKDLKQDPKDTLKMYGEEIINLVKSY